MTEDEDIWSLDFIDEYTDELFPKEDDRIVIGSNLTDFDKRCYAAICIAFACGRQQTVTPTMLFFLMGGFVKPTENDLQRISDSVEKLRRTSVTIRILNSDNYCVSYDGKMIECMRINDSLYTLFCEPCLSRYARDSEKFVLETLKWVDEDRKRGSF